jgi:hypothetical protein
MKFFNVNFVVKPFHQGNFYTVEIVILSISKDLFDKEKFCFLKTLKSFLPEQSGIPKTVGQKTIKMYFCIKTETNYHPFLIYICAKQIFTKNRKIKFTLLPQH